MNNSTLLHNATDNLTAPELLMSSINQLRDIADDLPLVIEEVDRAAETLAIVQHLVNELQVYIPCSGDDRTNDDIQI